MKSDLQKAALQKLANLSQNDRLSPKQRAALQERLLRRCTDTKKLVNGVNGVNGRGSAPRVMVCIQKLSGAQVADGIRLQTSSNPLWP